MGKWIIKNKKSKYKNKLTGEERESTTTMELVKEEAEPFFLTYSKQIIALYDLPLFNVTTKVFWKLLEYAEYNTGKVNMNKNRRKEVMQICNISKTSYYRAIDELIKAYIITKDGDVYTINESMFWKGDRDARNETMKAKMKVIFKPEFPEDSMYSNLVEEKEGAS